MKKSPLIRKTALAALLLAAVLFLTGCNLVVKDPEVDAKQVILTINGEEINKADFTRNLNNAYSRAVEEQQMYQQYYGIPAQPIDMDQLLNDTLDSTAKDIMLHQKAHELKLDVLTEEEEKALQEQADLQYQSYLTQIQQAYFTGTTLEGEELTKAIEAKAVELELTPDLFLQSAKESDLHQKLHDYAGKDVVISDEDLQTAFDQKVEQDKTNFTADALAYSQAVDYNQPVYYTPAGYRYVRQILIQLEQEDQDKLNQMEADLAPVRESLTKAQAEADRYVKATRNPDVTAEDQAFADDQLAKLSQEDNEKLKGLLALTETSEADTLAIAELEAKLPVYTALKEAQAELTTQEEALNQAREEAFAKIQAKTDEVLALATAEGADFEALVQEHDTDVGQPTRGYLVSAATTKFVPEFTQGAMALAAVGDVSQPIKTTYGYHILRFTEELPEGPVALETVKEALTEELHDAKTEELYHELEEAWLQEAVIVKYPERMED